MKDPKPVVPRAQVTTGHPCLAAPTESSTHPLTHPLTHSLTHSFTHSPTHSLIHSFPPSLTHSPTHSLINSFTLTIYSLILLHIHLPFYSLIPSLRSASQHTLVRCCAGDRRACPRVYWGRGD